MPNDLFAARYTPSAEVVDVGADETYRLLGFLGQCQWTEALPWYGPVEFQPAISIWNRAFDDRSNLPAQALRDP